MVDRLTNIECPHRNCKHRLKRRETYPYGEKSGSRVGYKCYVHGWLSKKMQKKALRR